MENKHFGHIAGEVECQDIRYTETNEAKIYDGLTQEAESVPGRCLVPKKGLVDVGERPHCAEQEVPGYRFVPSLIHHYTPAWPLFCFYKETNVLGAVYLGLESGSFN